MKIKKVLVSLGSLNERTNISIKPCIGVSIMEKIKSAHVFVLGISEN